MKNIKFPIRSPFVTILLCFGLSVQGQQKAQVTTVTIDIPQMPPRIDPMIYGQMLENVNDSMIYGGIVDLRGNVREHLIPKLRDLQIPVMRWPGGTVIHEYRWRNGIGPKHLRPEVSTYAWKGKENYQFGTDEFLQWCQAIGTTPYINFNMGNHPEYAGTIWEALEWIDYVNGTADSPMGAIRAQNGHADPYGVKYWCIGNENYGPWGRHTGETAAVYASRLVDWASAIKQQHPELQLLGIGKSLNWNHEVLSKAGGLIDFLTQHYYITSRVSDGKIQDPFHTLFAPAKMELHLSALGLQLDSANRALGREGNPIRVSIDEWNNRHKENSSGEYKFTRQSVRRQFDVAVVAGMLNAFIRQSATVGMANYIFPVNAHGLIRTVGNDDAYETAIYHVFKQYRNHMIGSQLHARVTGPSVSGNTVKPHIEGDGGELRLENEQLAYIDGAAVRNEDGTIAVSIVNRSHEHTHQVEIELPQGYSGASIWTLSHPDINASNEADRRAEIVPKEAIAKARRGRVSTSVPPCGLHIIKFFKDSQ